MNAVFLLLNEPFWLLLTTGLLGLCIGSFLNVVINRLPVMMEREWRAACREELNLPAEEATPRFNLMTPASTCPQCQHRIRAWENIPLISYLVLRGRCSQCQTHISMQYPVIEAVSALLSMAVAWRFGLSAQCLAGLLLSWTLLALAVIDLKTTLLPDSITLPILWLGLLLSLGPVFVDPQTSILGAAAGYLVLWSIYKLFKLLTGKEGMGYGDFKLLALLGAWLGWSMLPLVILLSSLVGAVVGIGLIVFKQHQRSQPIPFGPYLAAAGWIALLWGQELTQLYLQTLAR